MDKKVLAHLRHHLDLAKKLFKSDAFIAGGALRDLDNDKPIKDIDIFIFCEKRSRHIHVAAQDPRNRRYSYVGDVERLYGKKVKLLGQNYENWSGMRLFNILEIPHEPYPIQYIFYNHGGRVGPKALVDRFDINLCRIVDDGKRIYRTADYKSDRDNQQLTVNSEAHFSRESTTRRLERFKQKYPNFEVGEIPEQRVENWTPTSPFQWGDHLRVAMNTYSTEMNTFSTEPFLNSDILWTGIGR